MTIASANPLPVELSTHASINYVGFLDQNDLYAEYFKNDIGLICLSEDLDTPGFPSKIFSYLQAGLPSLYFGPSLKSYISIMESSGVGKDVRTLEKINKIDIKKMKERMPESVNEFKRQSCISEDSMKQFISKIVLKGNSSVPK